MYFNKASPPLNTSVQWRFCLRQAVFFDFNKNFLYNIYTRKKRKSSPPFLKVPLRTSSDVRYMQDWCSMASMPAFQAGGGGSNPLSCSTLQLTQMATGLAR